MREATSGYAYQRSAARSQAAKTPHKPSDTSARKALPHVMRPHEPPLARLRLAGCSFIYITLMHIGLSTPWRLQISKGRFSSCEISTQNASPDTSRCSSRTSWAPRLRLERQRAAAASAAAGPRRRLSEATIWDWSLRAVREPEPRLFRLCLPYQSSVSRLAGCGGRPVESPTTTCHSSVEKVQVSLGVVSLRRRWPIALDRRVPCLD